MASIDKRARLRAYDDAFIWLQDAGVALPCYNLNAPVVPLKINEQSRLFKLFLNDSGLLAAMSLENIQFDILQGNMSINMGSILENVFATQLKANGFALRYFNKDKTSEVDFVIQQGSHVIPVEIKSGKDYIKHSALDNLLSIREWNLNQAIVFCKDNIAQKDKITYLPWYIVMFFKQSATEKQQLDKMKRL